MSDDNEFDISKPAPSGTPRITVTPADRTPNEFEITARPAFPGPKTSFDAFSPERFNRPFGELKATDLRPSEQARWDIMSGLSRLGMSNASAQHLGGAVHDIMMATPMGAVFSADDLLTHDLPRGNVGASALDALGASPLLKLGRIARPNMVTPAERPTFRSGDYAAGRSPYIDEAHNVAGLPEGGAAAERRRAFEAATPGMLPVRMPQSLQEAARAGYRFSERSPVVYHPDAMGDATQRIRMLTESPYHGTVTAGPESAGQTYALLAEFDRGFPRGGMRPVTPADFDALRQRLLAISGGKDGAAASQAAHALEAYMLAPPPGTLRRGTAQDLADLRDAFAQGRGNWRAMRTGETVQDAVDYAHQQLATINSGKNANKVKQAVNKYTASDAGQAKLYGATPEEIGQLADAAVAGNTYRNVANRFAAGGGWGGSNLAGKFFVGGGVASHMMGMDPVTSLGIASSAAAIPGVVGGTARRMAEGATQRATSDAIRNIAGNSPLYRARLAASTPVTEPRQFSRDMIAMALMPQLKQQGINYWDSQFVPYENR